MFCFACGCLITPTPFERLSFQYWISFASLSEIILIMFMWLFIYITCSVFFFSPYSGLLISESISLLVLHNLDYYSYIISFKLGRLILPTLFFFLSIVLAILVPLPFWIISYKLSCWNFQKNYIKYVYQFENWIPFYVESPNSWA